MVAAPMAYAQTPAQTSLITKAGPAVSPNIMLTMDDSGSMAFRHMPEDKFASDTFATTNPVGSNTVRWDPSDTYKTTTNFMGTVPGDLTAANYVIRALRSPDTNTIYYNPEIRYQPWLSNDGMTRLPNSPVNAAYLSPPIIRGTSITSLTTVTGSKLLTLSQTGLAFTVGSNVLIASTTTPSTNWMFGAITAFTAGTGAMTVSVTKTMGSGTGLSWSVVQSDILDLTTVLPSGQSSTAIAATAIVPGATYTIKTTGTTSFTSIGSSSNSSGTTFTATAVGTGTGTVTVASPNGWCFALTNTSNCSTVSSTFSHDPGAYFRLTKTGTTYNSVTDYTKYNSFTINAAAATTYTKYSARTDCVGATTCTRDEERQNFANWYTYYRIRNLMARGAMMEAFGPQTSLITAGAFQIGSRYVIANVGTTSFTSIGASSNTVGVAFTATGAGSGTGTASTSTFRLGFGRINSSGGTVDGVSTKVIEAESSTSGYASGGIRDFSALRRNNLFKWLEDMPASGGTPLVEALNTDGVYYKRADNRGPWTDDPSVTNTVSANKTCRRSYAILTTDGYWNGSGVTTIGNADNTAGTQINGVGISYTYTPTTPYMDGTSNTLADVAMYYWKTDLQPYVSAANPGMDNKVPPVGDNTSFWQNMTTFTVGLGVRGTLNPATDLPALVKGTKVWPPAGPTQTANNVDDLWHAAVNSRGQYFSAKDPQELANAIKTALAGAVGGANSVAGTATSQSVFSTTGSTRKYVPSYTAGSWAGDISALPLTATGTSTTSVWQAATRMPVWSARNIVTWDTGLATPSGVAFKWTSLSAGNIAALGPVAATYTTQFMDFLWGSHANEGDAQPFRARLNAAGNPFILGDFINGTPVVVQGNFNGMYSNLNLGAGTTSDPNYTTFFANKAARTAVLFAGGNDGMLHAFKDTESTSGSNMLTDGQEIFAYVPRAVYPNLYKLTDKTYGNPGALEHQYFVDGPLRESDAYVKAPGASTASWRNYLIGSLGQGGRAVYALDVTDTTNLGPNTVRWELSDANDGDIGYVLSPVKVGILSNGRWVAIFGNGFSSSNGYATLFVVDIENAASTSASTRATAVQKLTVDTTGSNGLGGVTLIHDANGKISNIFAGDLKGRLWKFDYSSSAASNFVVSGGGAMFTATNGSGTAQPITASPVVYNHAQGGWLVLFGTGKLFSTADGTDTSVQSVYAVWDKPADTVLRPIARSALATRSLTTFAGTGTASSTTFIGISGSTIDWTSQRGWLMDITGVLPGGKIVYPLQVLGYDTALVKAVAPVQGTPAACDSSTGNSLELLLPVQTGSTPPNHNVDTNGDGMANGSDAYAVGFMTTASGVDAVIHSQRTSSSTSCSTGAISTCSDAPGGGSVDPLSDRGGGGAEGDCTGAACSGTTPPPDDCVPSAFCTEVNTCLSAIESATAGTPVCVKQPPKPTTPAASTRTYDRVWRRIINPPIH
jgi:type IV pilus assembly protein PilY1